MAVEGASHRGAARGRLRQAVGRRGQRHLHRTADQHLRLHTADQHPRHPMAGTVRLRQLVNQRRRRPTAGMLTVHQ